MGDRARGVPRFHGTGEKYTGRYTRTPCGLGRTGKDYSRVGETVRLLQQRRARYAVEKRTPAHRVPELTPAYSTYTSARRSPG